MKQKVGKIELSDITYFSDIAHGTKDKNNCTLNTISGEYVVFIAKSESYERKDEISSLYAIHKDYLKSYNKIPQNDNEQLWCIAETNLCGFFEKSYFETTHSADEVDDDWLDKVEDMTETCNNCVITEGKGVFANVDNGKHYIFAEYINGKAFAIRIKFL